MEYQTGTLVEFRQRPWVVQRSSDADLLVIKPLGGTDAEIVGLYLPLYDKLDDIRPYQFKRPSSADIGNGGYPLAARILYHACRLSFRDIAGPFHCLGRLSFEPRPYQMVPLIMALRQERVRLLISDDVGIGKTLEALLIAKELLDRNEIDRFAVICLPHLCEQWQNEIKDKFGLDAEIIRSSTVSRLERRLRGDSNIFRDIPFQVISIDYVKQNERMKIFLDHCPDLIIVDEAHTCARPTGTNKSQQQRHYLLNKLSEAGKQLVLLTATPHSGQTQEFQSIIGLLDSEFANYTLETAKEREALSKHFVQRRRADIKYYLDDNEVLFPSRVRIDNDAYNHTPEYSLLLNDLINYIKRGIRQADGIDRRKQRYIYWDLLAMMRGVMSSPEAGIGMLSNKIAKNSDTPIPEEDIDGTTEQIYIFNDTLKDLTDADDVPPEALEAIQRTDKNKLKDFIERLRRIEENDADDKVKKALENVNFALASDKNPIVFCQYIQTAEYVGRYLQARLAANRRTKNVAIDVISSRQADEERKMKIDALCRAERHVLVCTDCLSEGVNLQQGFDAVIHYDLPWNPNRMEQRDGRVDRFGQTSDEVLISTMYATNNPVDDIVLNVLYKKQREIKKKLGIYLPIADNDATLMESIMRRILVTDTRKPDNIMQPSLFSDEDFVTDDEQELKLKRMEENERLSHTYFAHKTKQLDPTRLTATLNEAHRVIGGVDDTCEFVVQELRNAGVDVKEDSPLCYSFPKVGSSKLLHYFPGPETKVRISFASPTPKGYTYIGRNHVFVEDLSRGVVNDTINGGKLQAGRTLVMETDKVKTRTTILLTRVRSVIKDVNQADRELLGEEMIFVGYRGSIDRHDFIGQDTCQELFLNARATGNVDNLSQSLILDDSINWINDEKTLRLHTDGIALERANKLVDAFTQYRTYTRADTYQVAEPVLPMDVIAAFVFIPKQ
ncbi:MAG: DEAD/DEAH box helicase [Mediterranea sp.]|jgi:superfamily II DNA or RNA helicase|nr:DEAD/DEAH box helicase [Mediterranea sp.]